MMSFGLRTISALGLVLVCAAAASPNEALTGPYGGIEPETPTRFIRFDALDAGPIFFGSPEYEVGGLGWVMLKATCQWNRFRLSAAYQEGVVDISDGKAGPVPVAMQFPVYVGYDIWHNPKKTWFFYGAVPDVYAEVGVNFVWRSVVKAALVCDLDYYGVGLRAEAGGYLNPAHGNTLYAALQVRLLTFGIGL